MLLSFFQREGLQKIFHLAHVENTAVTALSPVSNFIALCDGGRRARIHDSWLCAREGSAMRISVKAMTLAFGLVWGLYAVGGTGLLNLLWPPYGQRALETDRKSTRLNSSHT